MSECLSVFLVAYLLYTGDYVQISLLSEPRAMKFVKKNERAVTVASSQKDHPGLYVNIVSNCCHADIVMCFELLLFL